MGLKPREALKYTFREIQIYADGVNERDAEQWKQQLYFAWQNARLSRYPIPHRRGDKDPFPPFEDLLPKKRKKLSRKEASAENHERFKRWQRAINRKFKKKAAK